MWSWAVWRRDEVDHDGTFGSRRTSMERLSLCWQRRSRLLGEEAEDTLLRCVT